MGDLQEGSLCSQKRTKLLNFAWEHLDKPGAFWKSIRWTDESKIKLFVTIKTTMFGEKPTWCIKKRPSPNSEAWWWKCEGRGCFSACGPGWLHIIQGTMNSQAYQQIIDQNLLSSVRELKLGQKCIMHQDNDPNEWLQRKRIRILDWLIQSLDRNFKYLFHSLNCKIIKIFYLMWFSGFSFWYSVSPC